MATRKRTTKAAPVDVTGDVRSVETIRAAFEREDPCVPRRDPSQPRALSSPEEREATKRFTAFVSACVDALFGRAPAERPRAFTEWSEEQRALLTEIAKLHSYSLVNTGDLSERLLTVGAMTIAPGDPRYLSRYVGLVPPGVLERVVDERPLWLWIRLRLMGAVAPEALLAATSGLDDDERIELTRLAVENAYQLLRRFPMPEITPAQESADTAATFDALLPVLSAASTDVVQRTLARELEKEHPAKALTILLVHVLTDRGVPVDERVDDALADALDLYPVHGRSLLARFAAARRASLIARMEPVDFNLRGFWTYADMLEPGERLDRIAAALPGFRRPCRPDVARRVKELLRDVPPSARAGLRAIASAGGPNAALVAEVLAQHD